ncbi:hypothetical protein [Streptomyces sp. NPDC048002]|uniref:hypothetical protein n=1 Tax=unclassified Streptomyces TaxID=2593676 RepID=UPI003407A5F9
MPGSDISDESGQSNASSYTPVRLRERSDGSIDITEARNAVPDDAPPLFNEARAGVYNERSNTYYAVGEENQVARWDQRVRQWAWENRANVMRAIIDVAPTAIQGTAPFVPEGTARNVVTGIGVASQGLVAVSELYGQYQQHQSGGHVDPVQVTASVGRLLSTGLNTYGAVADQEAPATSMVSGAGTWVSAAATTADVVHHAHTDAQRRQDPGREMYGMYPPPAVGTDVGQYPPGNAPAPSSASASGVSSQQQSLTNRSAASFAPPVEPRSRDTASSSSREHGSTSRHSHGGESSRSKGKGKEKRRK